MLLRLGNISRKLRRVRKDYAENLYCCLFKITQKHTLLRSYVSIRMGKHQLSVFASA